MNVREMVVIYELFIDLDCTPYLKYPTWRNTSLLTPTQLPFEIADAGEAFRWADAGAFRLGSRCLNSAVERGSAWPCSAKPHPAPQPHPYP